MFETVRARLTLWYVSLLAAILVAVIALIYILLSRALYARIDDNLRVSLEVAMTSLANDLAEGQTVDDAARSTAAELASRRQLVAIYDGAGRLLGEAGREDDIVIPLPPAAEIPLDGDLLAIMETLYREVTVQRGLDRSFEDMTREITHLIDQMGDDERRAYLLESLFLNTVKYENDKLEAYMRKIAK